MWRVNCMSSSGFPSEISENPIRRICFEQFHDFHGFQQISLIFVETGLQVSCLLTFHPFAVVWAQPRTWSKCRHRSLRRSGEVWKSTSSQWRFRCHWWPLLHCCLEHRLQWRFRLTWEVCPYPRLPSALANMADQVPTNGSTLQSIKDYIAQMLADVTTQHNIAQAELTEISGYTSCDGTMASELSALAATTTVAATTTTAPPTIAPAATTTTLHPSSIALKTCLAEVETLNASLTKCLSEHKAAKEASDAVCMNFHFKSVIDAKAERCNESFSGSYEQYLERDVQILADYVSKKQNCTTYTSSTDAKASECDAKEATLFNKQLLCSQIVVVTTTPGMAPAATTTAAAVVSNAAAEEAACTNYHKQVEVCSDYDSCYEAVTLAKSGEKQSASTLEASRKAWMGFIAKDELLGEFAGYQQSSCWYGNMYEHTSNGLQYWPFGSGTPQPTHKEDLWSIPKTCFMLWSNTSSTWSPWNGDRPYRFRKEFPMSSYEGDERQVRDSTQTRVFASAKKNGGVHNGGIMNLKLHWSEILLPWWALNIYIIIFRKTLQLHISLAGFWRNLLPQLRSLLLTWQHQIHHMRQLQSAQLDVWSMLK